MKLSAEGFVIAALSQEGSLKKALEENLTPDDFEIYDEEFSWMLDQQEIKQPIVPRHLKRKFPEFEFIESEDSLPDLISELKRERAFVAVSSAIDEILGGEEPLDQDNALDKARDLIEILDKIQRQSGVHSSVLIKGGWEAHYSRMKNLSLLRDNGDIPGIPTGLDHLDLHWGGLQGETAYLYLGRPGDAKSFSLAQLAVEAAWHGYRAVVFSPEMSEHQHYARFHTLLSAKEEVQAALGMKEAFRNRALKDGRGFNMKQYKRFLQWIDTEVEGEIILFTQKYRREKMTVGYIRSQVQSTGADLVIIDPVYKLRPPRYRGTRWEELGEITDSHVELDHELNVPVVLSNQANRAMVGVKDDAPSMNSSFGSDTPVQEADAVIGVRHFSDDKILKFNCTKNRYGERFRFTTRFVPNVGILQDITPMNDEYARGFDPEKLAKLTAELEAEEKENDTYA
jgi:replicative DNA helicase